MRRLPLRGLMIATQLFPIVLICEYIAFRTCFSFIGGAISIFVMMHIKCPCCRTSFQSREIYKRFHTLRFWKTDVLEECPICHKAMYYGS
jgi:hypothetical protein